MDLRGREPFRGRQERVRSGAGLKRTLSGLARVPSRIAIILIRTYQKLVSPNLSPNCRFQPSCSQYAADSIARFGVIRGSWLGIKRIARCHPLHPGGFDPVPDSWKAR